MHRSIINLLHASNKKLTTYKASKPTPNVRYFRTFWGEETPYSSSGQRYGDLLSPDEYSKIFGPSTLYALQVIFFDFLSHVGTFEVPYSCKISSQFMCV